MFQKYDTKGEGSLGYEEFCSALGEFGHNTDDDDLRDIFDALVRIGRRGRKGLEMDGIYTDLC